MGSVATCSSCGTESPEGFRFCPNCGAPLVAAAAASVPARTERKVVTVLFCDLVGFTARSDSADPEDVRATLQPFHAIARREIERHGGTLDKFIGDAAMGVFGSPVVHEDDPERAVLTALAIVGAMRERQQQGGDRGERADAAPLEVRAGVNTGEAIVTLAPGVLEGENVAGDVVNTASRLQSVAPVGGIVVGERTFAATRDLIEYEAMDPVTVKGKAEPLPVWRVLSARTPAGSAPRRAHRAPFVGRARERGELEDALRRTVEGSSANLVTIVGEPGVGKSRLVAELQTRAGDLQSAVRWRRGRCLPYGDGVAFWAIGEIVKDHAGILESDPPERRDAKLAAALEGVPADPPERAWLRARLAPLIGLPGEPGIERDESFAAWRRFFEAMAATAPLAVVIEDLHWADPAVARFLIELMERIASVPVLLIVTARPELYDRHPGWGDAAPSATTLSLPPLSEEDAGSLVSSLFEGSDLPVETRALIVERAEGNPLYAEELARMLADQGLLDERGSPTSDLSGLSFPQGIQALIAARLDAQTPARKSLLQAASVVGRVFWSGAVAFLADGDEPRAREELEELSKRELVRPSPDSSVEGQREYSFWHAMVRDVAYAQIPRAARAAKHRAAMTWIERTVGDRAADVAEILAYHATSALDLSRAAGETEGIEELRDAARGYLRTAAARAMAMDVGAAEAALRRALDLTATEHPERPSIEAGLAEAAFQAGRLQEAQALLESVVAGFRAAGRVGEMADSMVRLSVAVEYGGDPVAGRKILTEAIATLDRLGPGAGLARALAESAGTLMVAGRFGQAVAEGDRAIALADSIGEAEASARAHNFRGYCRVVLGDLDGLVELRESIETALALGLGRTPAVSYSNLGAALDMTEGPLASLACRREGLEFASARGLREIAAFLRNGMLGSLRSIGDWDEVVRLGAEVAADAREAGADYEEAFAEVDRVAVLVARGEPGAAGLAEKLLAQARPMEDPPLLMSALAAAASARLASGDDGGAAALVGDAIDITGGDAVVTRGSELAEFVRVAVSAGRLDLASRAMEDMDQLPLSRHSNMLHSARATLGEAQGQLEVALVLYDEAAERWEGFGHVLELAHARLGGGRCLVRLGRGDDARDRLMAAREAFARVGATSLVAEADVWLGADREGRGS